jgi:hypothetical protein
MRSGGRNDIDGEQEKYDRIRERGRHDRETGTTAIEYETTKVLMTVRTSQEVGSQSVSERVSLTRVIKRVEEKSMWECFFK